MKFFIIYAASGCGKSKLLYYARDNFQIDIHQKETDRNVRLDENPNGEPELKFVDKIDLDKQVVTYEIFGNMYGIKKDLVDKAIKNNINQCIIFSDINAIKKFKKLFPNTIVIFLYCDLGEMKKRFLKRGDTDTFKKRENKIIEVVDNFVKNYNLFDNIIIGKLGTDYSIRQIGDILVDNGVLRKEKIG